VNAAATRQAGRREWVGLAVLALPCLLYAMDLTVLNLAVPQLSADLKPSSAQLLWIVDIYGFMLAGSLVTMGTLGDRIGRRRLLLGGAGAFGVASVLAASSTSAGQLIAARALLGVAGATLAPSTLSLLRNMFADPRQRTLAIAVWITSFSVGGAVGPLAGGVLLERFWWGSVFLLAVPVMALLLVVGPLLLPEFYDPRAGRLDLPSAAMSLVAVLTVIYGLKQLAQGGLGWLPVLSARWPIRCWTCGCSATGRSAPPWPPTPSASSSGSAPSCSSRSTCSWCWGCRRLRRACGCCPPRPGSSPGLC
jgi:MFS transporter, DHA2 family, multidrug resistance protein